jgi:hypothetical protein
LYERCGWYDYGGRCKDKGNIEELWETTNEAFDCNKNDSEIRSAVCGRIESISTADVGAAITKSKSGKAGGPSGVVVEMVKALGDAGKQWVTDVEI